MKTVLHFNFKNLFFQGFCLVLATGFFLITTNQVLAVPKDQTQKSDPFALTEEKLGLFQGLPKAFKGFFSSDNQVLNGFFNFIQRNLGGATSTQGEVAVTPEFPKPSPVTGEFIKVTSDWTASCIQDQPPDELHPSTAGCPPQTDASCPWNPAPKPPCASTHGNCCMVNHCVEFCIENGGFVTYNYCGCSFGHGRIFDVVRASGDDGCLLWDKPNTIWGNGGIIWKQGPNNVPPYNTPPRRQGGYCAGEIQGAVAASIELFHAPDCGVYHSGSCRVE